MHHTPAAVLAFAIVLGSCPAQAPQYTRQSLKAAMQTAHTPAEYDKLALYFRELSLSFKHLSDEQGNTVHQELEHPALGSKYPTAVDRARRMQEHYLEQFKRAHERSEYFKSMASGTEQRSRPTL